VTAATRMTTELKRTAPVGATGDLSRNTGVEVVSADRRTVKAEARIDVDYAEVVVQGSRAHPIVATNAQALRFYWPKKGAVVFFRRVNHPGTTPNPFFERVVSKWAEFLR
jgi:hypothetical protein